MTLRLRAVGTDDFAILFDHQLDQEAAKMAAFPPRNQDAFVEHWRRILNDPSVLARAVVDGSEVLGYVASFDTEEIRSIGYWIGRRHWGRGFGRAAVSLFLEIETTRPLFAHVAAANVRSTRILERCGFRIVGSAATPATTGEPAVDELTYRLD